MDRRSWRGRLVGTAVAGALIATGLTVAAPPAHAALACNVQYTILSQWPGGFTASMNLQNLGDAWNGWTLTYSFPGDQRVTGGWNGDFNQLPGSNQVTVTNKPYNGTVPTGGQVSSVGFYGTFSGTNRLPVDFAVNGWKCLGGVAPTTVVSTSALTVPEGTSAPFTVRLSAAPTTVQTVSLGLGLGTPFRFAGDVVQTSLTFSPANWNIPQAVSVYSDEDPDFAANTDTVTMFLGSTPSAATVSLTQQDNDDPNAPSLVYTPDATINSQVRENFGYRTFFLKLSKAPATGPVTVGINRVSGDADITLTPTTLTFTDANWDTYQRVELHAAEDDDAVNSSTRFRLSPDRGVVSLDVVWSEQDNDFQGIVVTPPAPPMVVEGGTVSARVRLSAQPLGIVGVRVENDNGDTDLTVTSGASLTFNATNWNVDQVVTFAAAEDADSAPGIRQFLFISGNTQSSLPTISLTLHEIDND